MNAENRRSRPPGLYSRVRIVGIRIRSLAYRVLVLPVVRPRGRVPRQSRVRPRRGTKLTMRPGEEPFYSRRFRFERECSKFLHNKLPR